MMFLLLINEFVIQFFKKLKERWVILKHITNLTLTTIIGTIYILYIGILAGLLLNVLNNNNLLNNDYDKMITGEI